ncbi:SDR family NAD(P)-dependent oxidoreductase [Subtercola endophyticus]|uniref:SDR family NAD(P)-dependent oxidoreductase n=1 Tax=Subtercola endophyticus TaxID=2895559 RepID=UPI001E56CFE0|nr:SDR family NAD(P)-dependent oxidoreductase [Subtercola endophyticus]UFS60567.1 SDR family NAD(P)-dependent oxidoreductase [Subtercola endophyticus]
MTDHELISTRFDASSTADEVLSGIDLGGLQAVVTGGASGIGAETARALAAAEATVTLAVRNTRQGDAVADSIAAAGRSSGPAAGAQNPREAQRPRAVQHPRVAQLDLADPASIDRFVHNWRGPLHLLINNAGVVTGGLEGTAAGYELQFATNHLGHFALATGLHDALALGAADRGGARIVSLSSTAHMRSNVDFDDLQFESRPYDPQLAYAQSKTANSLFAVEATRLWASDGIVANAVNPGGVATGLQRNFTPQQKASLDAAEAAGVFTYKTVEQGASTTLVAAVSPEFAHTGGHYLDDCREAYTVPDEATLAEHPHGVKRWALDPAAAERLWAVSTGLLRG